MKKKYFLRGLGIGIIITALLLCIAYRKQMTEQSIINQAKKLGMEFPETTAPVASDTPTELPLSPSPTASAAPAMTATPQPQATAAPTKKPSKKVSSTSKVTLKISAGMDSRSVSKKLKSEGIIKDASDFDQYLIKNGYADRICIGNYKVPKNATYHQIAKIIAK